MKVLDKLKNLKLRRWGDNVFTDAINKRGGTGLTGNLLDDWANAVTQGEYTKYEDIPITNEEGLLIGWRRLSDDYELAPLPPSAARSSFVSRDIRGEIIKDGTFKKSNKPL